MSIPEFDLFTEQARRAVWSAYLEARWFDHDYLASEHLLVGLLRQPTREIEAVFLGQGIEGSTVLREARTLLEEQPSGVTSIMLTPRVRGILEKAIQLGERSSVPNGTIHILHALLIDPESNVSFLLGELGFDVKRAVELIRQLPQELNYDELLQIPIDSSEDPAEWSAERLQNQFSMPLVLSIEKPYDLREAARHSMRALGQLVRDVAAGGKETIQLPPRTFRLDTQLSARVVALLVLGWLACMALVVFIALKR